MSTWKKIVGEDSRGTDEDVVGEVNAGVNGNKVLHTAASTDHGARIDINCVAQLRLCADSSAATYMGEVPDFGSRPNSCPRLDDGGWMDIGWLRRPRKTHFRPR